MVGKRIIANLRTHLYCMFFRECHFRPPCRKVDGAHEQVHEIAEIERLNADKGIAADIRKREGCCCLKHVIAQR